jgi:hypothetical protein
MINVGRQCVEFVGCPVGSAASLISHHFAICTVLKFKFWEAGQINRESLGEAEIVTGGNSITLRESIERFDGNVRDYQALVR